MKSVFCVALMSAVVLSSGCDFKAPLSTNKEPLKATLIGSWKAGDVAVKIAQDKDPDTYKVEYMKTNKEKGVEQKEELKFRGWISAYKNKDYFSLQLLGANEKPGTYLLGEVKVEGDGLQFNRINRDFPNAFDIEKQGEVGLSNLTSAELLKHIDDNNQKKNFYESTNVYTRVKMPTMTK